MMKRIGLFLIGVAIGFAGPVSYTYDPAGRLTQVDYGNGSVIAYTYDKAGNLLNRTVTSSAPAPTIRLVISAGDFGKFTNAAPGSWVEIYGSNLSNSTRQWAGADFSGNNAPTMLDGVQVTAGGQKAFVYYISPGQVDAQLPSNLAAGPTMLTVGNGTQTSAPATIRLNSVMPGLLAPLSFEIGGNQYVVALLPDGVTYILPPNAIPGLASRQAKPGETIIMYGIGFGAVSPDIPAGKIVTQSNQLVAPLQIQFGQTSAKLQYDGLAPSFVGLYQFNVVVPQVPDNDLTPLTFTLGGATGTQILFIAVKQ